MAGPGSGAAQVPAATLRAWDDAEARLFPLIMARPQEYERSLTLIQALVGWLRATCPDVPALLAQSGRGAGIVADAAGSPPGGEPAAAGPDLAGAGLRLDLITAAACAMRYRELVASQAAAARVTAFERARDRAGAWAVVEEIGDPARAPYVPYQRIEAHVPSGRAVLISIGLDESLSRAVWRLDAGTLDPASGHLAIGSHLGSYAASGECDAALAGFRAQPS